MRDLAKLMLNSLYGIFGVSRNDIALVYVGPDIPLEFLTELVSKNIVLKPDHVNTIPKAHAKLIREYLKLNSKLESHIKVLTSGIRLFQDFYLSPIISSLITSNSRKI